MFVWSHAPTAVAHYILLSIFIRIMCVALPFTAPQPALYRVPGGGNLFLVYCGQILMFGKEHTFEKYNGTSTQNNYGDDYDDAGTYTIIIMLIILLSLANVTISISSPYTLTHLPNQCYYYLFVFVCVENKFNVW